MVSSTTGWLTRKVIKSLMLSEEGLRIILLFAIVGRVIQSPLRVVPSTIAPIVYLSGLQNAHIYPTLALPFGINVRTAHTAVEVVPDGIGVGTPGNVGMTLLIMTLSLKYSPTNCREKVKIVPKSFHGEVAAVSYIEKAPCPS